MTNSNILKTIIEIQLFHVTGVLNFYIFTNTSYNQIKVINLEHNMILVPS